MSMDCSRGHVGSIEVPELGQGGKKIACGGGGDGTEAHLPNYPPSLVVVPGGGFRLGLPYLPCRGGGGGNPNIHGSK